MKFRGDEVDERLEKLQVRLVAIARAVDDVLRARHTDDPITCPRCNGPVAWGVTRKPKRLVIACMEEECFAEVFDL